MLRSIFRKLLLSYIPVLLIGFGFIAWWMSYMMKDFIYHEKETLLTQEEETISSQFHNLGQGEFSVKQATDLINGIQKTMHFRIDFIYRGENENLKGFSITSKRDLIDPTLIETVFTGKTVQHIGTFKKNDRIGLLSMGFPYIEGNQVTGALFLHSPVLELNDTLEMIQGKIIFTAILIAIPAIILLYFLSLRISGPLIRMNQAAALIGNGKFSERIIVSGNDEISQLARTFNQMVERLERLEKNRKELIMNVSHELRTPVTSVRGFIQGIIENVIPKEQHQRYLSISLKELERLSMLISKMLDLSAIESGKVQLNRVIIRWATLVESVVEGFEGKLQEKNIALNVSFPEEIIKVYGDPDRLKQILINLLDNSIRFTPDGGRISIISSKIDNWIKVQLEDSGVGISPEDLPQIWDRFFTADWSRSMNKGSGLGLTIVKHLVELHGGQIKVESQLEKGTIFTLLLPCSEHTSLHAIDKSINAENH